MKYPVITLWQPWAQLISMGFKTIETRTHSRFACLKNKTILIHAGAKYDSNSLGEISKYLKDPVILDYVEPQILCSAFVYDFVSRIVNVEDEYKALIDCYSVQRSGLYLKDIKKIKPILIKGKQGIWYYDL